MSLGFKRSRFKEVMAILLTVVCFTGLGTREALGGPWQTTWDCSDALYHCQAADLVPDLAQRMDTVEIYVPEGQVLSYHYKDSRKKTYDISKTEILVLYLESGTPVQVASAVVPQGGEANGEFIAPKSQYYYLSMECRYASDCDGRGYLRTSK
ncbi:hypothetical protein C8Z91_20255 [Paenibacillus elgii]|uniref:Uncharacterized protein n=1 Tax=Paenibacillus elgii TaxID=189691 RepID=A0A2T6FZL6_9BACL|nr:hypothetical protein [Paenibacillus elgii]PUA37359.1 hypothetical protein C8Z91_20255 [Paenibacillus elgii]